MKKYRVRLSYIVDDEIEVEAKSKEEAEQLGYEAIAEGSMGTTVNEDATATEIPCHTGENKN